jgi:very-short-patch-repair endonuclease
MRYQKHSLTTARRLRRRATDAERRLWSRLRAQAFHGLKFRRQHPIGRYVVDFACLERALVVELDGGQHSVAVDARRTAAIERHGFRILRFWNNQVLGNLDGVLRQLEQEIGKTNRPSPRPSPPSGARGPCGTASQQRPLAPSAGRGSG